MTQQKSFLGRHWRIKSATREGELIDQLLHTRGIQTSAERENFLTPDFHTHTHASELLAGLPRAVERISHALQKRERILICGDYDVDGVTASAILFTTLRALGAEVSVRLPHRVKDGYGLNPRLVEEANQLNVKLIITVDNGISAVPAVTRANALGIDVIVTDHHLPPATLPPAYAIVNPRQLECPYPYKQLAGAGVAYKLAEALLPPELFLTHRDELLALATLGTIADVCPLTEENRVLVTHGLLALQNTRNRGLRRLMENAGIGLDKKTGLISFASLTAEDIGYRIAPRLNAAGRLDSALLAFQTLTHPTQAVAFADQLESLNRERQKLTEKILQSVEQKLHAKKTRENSSILIASDASWHAGVIGLVAGKLAEKYYQPVVLMEERGAICVGSCRGPTEFNLTAALTEVSDLLTTFGGHRSAAGFTLPRVHRAEFEKRLTAIAAEKIPTQLAPTLELETMLTETDLDLKTVRALRSLAPFGAGNPEPLFLFEDLNVTTITTVGDKNQHLKFKFGRANFSAIGFGLGGAAPLLHEKKRIDAAVTLEENVWRGESSVQLKIADVR